MRFTITDVLGMTALIAVMHWGTLRYGFFPSHWLLLITPFVLAFFSARRGSDRQSVFGWLAVAWLIVLCDGAHAFIQCFEMLGTSNHEMMGYDFRRRVTDEFQWRFCVPLVLSPPVLIAAYQCQPREAPGLPNGWQSLRVSHCSTFCSCSVASCSFVRRRSRGGIESSAGSLTPKRRKTLV